MKVVILEAKCVRVEYEAGERITCQGVKGHQFGKKINGRYFRSAGYGVGQMFVSSKLLLFVVLDDPEEQAIRIDDFFKKNIGKLTELRREIISNTMPAMIKIRKIGEKYLSEDPEASEDYRTLHYEAPEKELDDWLVRAHDLLAPKKLREFKKTLKTKREELRKKEVEAEKASEKQFWQEARLRWAEEDRRLEERRKNALKLAFVRGRNPKYGTEQWEAKHEGRLYILRKEDRYEIGEGVVPVERVFDLVPERIVLVEKI